MLKATLIYILVVNVLTFFVLYLTKGPVLHCPPPSGSLVPKPTLLPRF